MGTYYSEHNPSFHTIAQPVIQTTFQRSNHIGWFSISAIATITLTAITATATTRMNCKCVPSIKPTQLKTRNKLLVKGENRRKTSWRRGETQQTQPTCGVEPGPP